MGGGNGHVDAPRLVEEPVVLRMVDPGYHPGHREFLLGQQRDDQVVLVISCCRHDHIRTGQTGGVEGRHLAGVPHHPLHTEGGTPGGDGGVYLDEQDFMASFVQVSSEIAAYVARPRR